MRIRTGILFSLALLTLFIGCETDDNTSPAVPYEPDPGALEAGPSDNAEFLAWNSTGHQRADSAGFTVDGWCYSGQPAEIQIECMVGLTVPANALLTDSLHCDIEIPDAVYAQLEYGPDGVEFAEPVRVWFDTSVVTLPEGIDFDDVQVYYYSRESGEFYAMDTWFDEAAGYWYAETTHFSRYILGTRTRANASTE